MAEFKRRTLYLNSGKQIKLFGNSIAIGKSLEVGEGYAPNIFSLMEQQQEEKPVAETPKPPADISKDGGETQPGKRRTTQKTVASVANPHRLTVDEMLEIADYNIRLWMDFKDNIRKFGPSSPKVFSRDV